MAAGRQISSLLTRGRLELPADFWWRPRTLAIIALQAGGWAAHGLALWLLVRTLPGQVGPADAVFSAAISAVLGGSTGLPGGVGATEGLLGVSLGLQGIPLEHLALAVAAFRLATFWIWLPVGWIAWAAARR